MPYIGNIGMAFVCALIGYLLGSINPAYLIVRRKGYDVRTEGSGNAGASNALIIAGKAAFLAVVALDVLKAWTSCRICRGLFPALTAAEQIGGAACVLGHLFPFTLGFRGGKGLACQGGVILSWSWRWFLLLLGAAILLAVRRCRSSSNTWKISAASARDRRQGSASCGPETRSWSGWEENDPDTDRVCAAKKAIAAHKERKAGDDRCGRPPRLYRGGRVRMSAQGQDHALARRRALSFFAAATEESVSSVKPHSCSSRSSRRSQVFAALA